MPFSEDLTSPRVILLYRSTERPFHMRGVLGLSVNRRALYLPACRSSSHVTSRQLLRQASNLKGSLHTLTNKNTKPSFPLYSPKASTPRGHCLYPHVYVCYTCPFHSTVPSTSPPHSSCPFFSSPYPLLLAARPMNNEARISLNTAPPPLAL